MMTKHVHAELMAEYAKDAMETDKPWERWEFFSVTDAQWRNFHCPPVWSEVVQYRRKPQTSRERFEEWRREKIRSNENTNTESPLWEAWQEAERQAKERGDE